MKKAFVSSTFIDFQIERDILRQKVYPYIQSFVKEHHEYFAFQDLRWGVDTTKLSEKEASIKIINYCLDEIYRTKPYFIVFLGDYYGTVMDAKIIKKEANRHQLFLKDYDVSLTELEVRYALKEANGDYSHILVYEREINGREIVKGSDNDLKKLNDLKVELQEKCGDHYRKYLVTYEGDKIVDGLENLEQLIIKDVLDILGKDIKEVSGLDEYQKEQLDVSDLFTYKASFFSARQNDLQNYFNLIEKNFFFKNIYSISGEHGSGKTTLISKLSEEFKKKYEVINFECGLTKNSHSASQIMLAISHLLASKYRFDIPNNQPTDKIYNDILKEADKLNKKIFIFIDGIDQLSKDMDARFLKFLVPSLKNIFFIVTGVDSLSNMKTGILEIKMDDLDKEEKISIANRILSNLGKELNPEVIDAIVDSESIVTPLHVEYLITYLSLLDKQDFDRIYKEYNNDFITYEKSVIEKLPTDLDELAYVLIQRMSGKDKTLLFIMKLIALSYRGLSIRQIEKICQEKQYAFDVHNFLRFVNYIPEFFLISNDERYTFFHGSFKKGLLKNMKEEEINECYSLLYDANTFYGDYVIENYYYGYQLADAFRLFNAIYEASTLKVITIYDFINEDNGDKLVKIFDDIDSILTVKNLASLYLDVSYMCGLAYLYIDTISLRIKALEAFTQGYLKIFNELIKLDVPYEFFLIQGQLHHPFDELTACYKDQPEKALIANAASLSISKQLSDKYNLDFKKIARIALEEEVYYKGLLNNSNKEYLALLKAEIAAFKEPKDKNELMMQSVRYGNYADALLKERNPDYSELLNALIKTTDYNKSLYELNRDDYYRIGLYLSKLNELLKFFINVPNMYDEEIASKYFNDLLELRKVALQYVNLEGVLVPYVISTFMIAKYYEKCKEDYGKTLTYGYMTLSEVAKGAKVLDKDFIGIIFNDISELLCTHQEFYDSVSELDSAIINDAVNNFRTFAKEDYLDKETLIAFLKIITTPEYTHSLGISVLFSLPYEDLIEDMVSIDIIEEKCRLATIRINACMQGNTEEGKEESVTQAERILQLAKRFETVDLVKYYVNAYYIMMLYKVENSSSKEKSAFFIEALSSVLVALKRSHDSRVVFALFNNLTSCLEAVFHTLKDEELDEGTTINRLIADIYSTITERGIIGGDIEENIKLGHIYALNSSFMAFNNELDKLLRTPYFDFVTLLFRALQPLFASREISDRQLPVLGRVSYYYLYNVENKGNIDPQTQRIATALLMAIKMNVEEEYYNQLFIKEERELIEKYLSTLG